MPRRKTAIGAADTGRASPPKDPAEPAGFTHRVVAAAGSRPPDTTAASSVFSAARPKRKPPTYSAPIDPHTIAIRKGVPIQPHRRNGSTSTYRTLMERMTKGDMVELPNSKAKSLYSWANANGVKASMRRLTDSTSGVWRLS